HRARRRGRRGGYGRLRLRRRSEDRRRHDRPHFLCGVPMRTSPRPLLLLLPLTVFAASRALAARPPPATSGTTTAPAPTPPAPAPAPAAPSPEAVAEAARHLDLAKQALKGKHFAQAAQLFEVAAALGRQASAQVSAGLAWEQAERPDRAADAYARAALSSVEP